MTRRLIPSIDDLLQRPALARAAAVHGHRMAAAAARDAARELRDTLGADGAAGPAEQDGEALGRDLEARALALLDRRLAPSLQRVINATGVIVHTNLGRAPLAAEAIARAAAIGAGYSNLEFDTATGRRGHRHVHAERLLRDLTGAEAAVIVNNNAAGVLLVLAALAHGREVIVSRGELVEIGGGFRVPDVMSQSGATLREVGTTNRTRVNDYAAAIGDRTALLLRVHPSNFRIEGFTERPAEADLAALAHRFDLPLVHDLGSGWPGDDGPTPAALADEPSVRDSLASGADLVLFSGDKLLGGPQAGLIVGRTHLVDRLRAHPLMRAVRVDKLTYAAMEATLAIWLQEPGRTRLPVYRMLTLGAGALAERAKAFASRLTGVSWLECELAEGVSTIGGGSAPGSALPTTLVGLTVGSVTADEFARRLRSGMLSVVARIQDNRVVIDLRTVDVSEEDDLVTAIVSAAAPARPARG